jgi:hypothetical protein
MIATRPQRPISYVFPLLLIAGGALLLLANTGMLPEGAGWRLLQLWPLLLVLIGTRLIVDRLFEGETARTVALAATGLVVVGGLVYVVAGPSLEGGTYQTATSSSSLGAVSRGQVTIDGAGTRVEITGDAGSDQLYQASVDHAGPAPRISYAGGDLHISSGPTTGVVWNQRADTVRLSLNPAVPWTVVVNGAGVSVKLDLSAGRLQSFQLNGVGSKADLTLGPPDGQVPIRLAGVGTEATVSIPAGTQYRTTSEGVATTVGGSSQTPGWDGASDRYDMSASGVAARITLQERN